MPVPTTSQRRKLDREPVSDPHVILLEFQEDGRTEVTRVAVNTEDVTHNGNTYTRASIGVQLPDTGSDDTRAQLTVSNIDRTLSRILDAARQRISVRIIFVDTANPDVAIVDTKNLLVLEQASGTSGEISVTLGPRVSLQEPVPFQKTTRQGFPGVWIA